MKMSHHLNLDHAPLLICCPKKVCLSNVGCTYFLCLTSISIYIDPWKSFMKFGIKKSHEMISYNLSWIALLREWNYRSSTKPCYLAQMTLIELYNKIMKGSCRAKVKKMPQSVKNSNLSFTVILFLTCVEQSLTLLAWSCTLNKS